MPTTKEKFLCYAVVDGKRNRYVVDTWEECLRIINANPEGAKYKGFYNRAVAKGWVSVAQNHIDERREETAELVLQRNRKHEPNLLRKDRTYYVVIHGNGDAFIATSEQRAKEVMSWNPGKDAPKQLASIVEAIEWIADQHAHYVGAAVGDMEIRIA